MAITLCSPILVGVYENGEKVRGFSSSERAGDALIEILREIRAEFDVTAVLYANGPGSFTGIKVAYVILKTFCVASGCDFYAVCGFDLNANGAISANKNMSFVREGGKIILVQREPSKFSLPLNLTSLARSQDTLPNYVIDAI